MGWLRFATSVALWAALWLRDGASGFEVVVNPAQTLDAEDGVASIRCESKDATPIADCQFRVWPAGKWKEGVVLIATHGESVQGPSPSYRASFTREFDNGLCGVTLHDLPEGRLLVGCKLTTANESATSTTSLSQTARQAAGVATWVSCVSVAVLLAVLAVAAVAFAVAQRRSCLGGRPLPGKSKSAKSTSLVSRLKRHRSASSTSVHVDVAHPQNGQSQRKQRPPPPGRRPEAAGAADPRARPPPAQVQAARPSKEGHGDVKRGAQGGVDRTGSPRPGPAAAGSQEGLYANASELRRANGKPDDRGDPEYWNLSPAKGPFPKSLPPSQPGPKLPHKTAARASRVVPSKGLRGQEKGPRPSAEVQPSLRVPSILGKDSADKVVYAELRSPVPAVAKAKQAPLQEDIVYAELDFNR